MKRVAVSRHVLSALICGSWRSYSSNLPETALLVRIVADFDGGNAPPSRYWLYFTDPSFEEVPNGTETPIFPIEITMIDYQGVAQGLIDMVGWNG